ncbi:MAG: hypothetical protein Fur0037_13160 [Planctomycetota bacterium]
MPQVFRGGRSIHFTATGSGPSVLLVPGLGAGARLFGTLPRRFAREGFTCAALDPVGLPPSGPPRPTLDLWESALDVRAAAEALPPPVFLVGTSLGGKIALAATGGDPGPIARVVLLASSAVATQRSLSVYRFFERIASEADPASIPDLLAPFLFGHSFHERHPGAVEDILRAMTFDEPVRSLMRSQARALCRFRVEDLARACPVETLCLAGSEDSLTMASEVERTAALLPRGRYELVEGAGHSLLLEHAGVFDRVLSFLREGVPGP